MKRYGGLRTTGRGVILAVAASWVLLTGAARAASVVYQAGGLRIAVDEVTGTIVELSHPDLGIFLSAGPESSGLLDIAYPSEREFLDGVREAGKLGVNVAPFASVQTVRNRFAERHGARPGSGDWTYHKELIPNFRPHYSKFWDGAEVRADNPNWQADVLAAFSAWIDKGVVSFGWDQFRSQIHGGPESELVSLIRRIRSLARRRNPESTFNGEMEHWELDGAVLDYTWLWQDYRDTGPILNLFRTPRLNCNFEKSALVVKKAFCDGLYINAMPRKPDDANGTALIRDEPDLSRALKEVAPLRKQFLPYFTEGVFLGDSILCAPAVAFVRGHQLPGGILVTVLNDGASAQRVALRSDLRLWLPGVTAHEERLYDGRGKLRRTVSGSVPQWHGATDVLQPEELAFFEIRALR